MTTSSGLNATLSLPSPWNRNHACFRGGTRAQLQGSSGSTWMRSIVCRLRRTKRLRSDSHTRMFSSKWSHSKLYIFRSSSMPSSWWCFCAVATSSPCNCIGTTVDKCSLTSTSSLISPVVPSDSWFGLPSFMVCTSMWSESSSCCKYHQKKSAFASWL